MALSEKQIKRLKKLTKFGEDKDIATIENLIELDEKIEDVKEHLDTKFDALQEELKKKLESELVIEIDKEELKGEKGTDGRDGRDGKNYILTNLDKKNIARSIVVPVVEKVVEKTEVIREQPIEIIKEVALKDSGEEVINKINEDETTLIKKEKIEDFAKTEQGILDRAVSIVDNRTSFLINKVSNLAEQVANINPVETQDLQAVTDLGDTTTNSIEAQSFITTGGTSADFVKGDGSLDGTTYLTSESDTLASVTGRGATTTVQSTFSGGLISPTIIGGTGTTDDLILQTTSGVGTTGADMIFKGGNNGATEFMRILNGGNVGIGTASPGARLHTISTTEQFRSGYDASNYWNATTNSTGVTTLNAVGSGTPQFVFSKPVGMGGNSSGVSNFGYLYIRDDATSPTVGAYSTALFDLRHGFGSATTIAAMQAINRATPVSGKIAIGADMSVNLTNGATAGTLIGVRSQLSTIGGTNGDLDNHYFFKGESNFLASGNVITNKYGLHISETNASGALNTYEVYLNGLTGSTNQFGIYQAQANSKNYFAGNVGIGTTTPTEKLHIVGNGLFTGNLQMGSIYDNAGTPVISIDPNTRQLYDTTGAFVASWSDATRGLTGGDDGGGGYYYAVNINSATLNDPNGATLDWTSKQLYGGGVTALDWSMSDGVQFNVGGTNTGRLGSNTEAGYFSGTGGTVYLADSTYAINATGQNYFTNGTYTVSHFVQGIASGDNTVALTTYSSGSTSADLTGSFFSFYGYDSINSTNVILNDTSGYAVKATGVGLFDQNIYTAEFVTNANSRTGSAGAGFFYDGSNEVTLSDGSFALAITGNSIMPTGYLVVGNNTHYGFADFEAKANAYTSAGYFEDSSSNNVYLSDGIYAINATGITKTTGRHQAVRIESTDYTLTTADEVVVFTATAIATLPTATGTGQTYRIVCRAGTLTIDGDGTDTIKGELTQTLTAGSDLIITDTATGIWE